ncbi:MAG: hypothetical protein GY811_29265, partial [Myxococcales bacterium]|nr:hypothetical protein [Myxococcales bacterium]
MSFSSTKHLDSALNELATLENKLAKRSDDADAQLIDHTSELLELLRGEVARLKAQVRWLEG